MRNARSNEEENQEEEKNTNIIEKFNTLEQKTVFFQKMSTKNVILKVVSVCVCFSKHNKFFISKKRRRNFSNPLHHHHHHHDDQINFWRKASQ